MANALWRLLGKPKKEEVSYRYLDCAAVTRANFVQSVDVVNVEESSVTGDGAMTLLGARSCTTQRSSYKIYRSWLQESTFIVNLLTLERIFFITYMQRFDLLLQVLIRHWWLT